MVSKECLPAKKAYQPLTLPSLVWNKKDFSDNNAELIVSPLEAGFGVTLGNALRRVLLSAIEGTGVTSVIIEGVNNEFSVINGVVEDTLQIILNIKEIVIKNTTGESGKMSLDIRRKGPVYVSDIQADDHLKLINKDFIIANISEGGSLKIDFFVENGRGYVPAKWPSDNALNNDGRIYLDVMFSPIMNIEYRIEKTRVGNDIDFDKLFFRVKTNGVISSSEAISYASSALRSQLELFLTCDEIKFRELVKEDTQAEMSLSDISGGFVQTYSVDLFLKSIDDLELSVRAHNCLVNAGIKRVIDLVNMSDDDVLKLKNFGRKSLKEVKEVLTAFGLRFGMNIKELDLKKALKKKVENGNS